MTLRREAGRSKRSILPLCFLGFFCVTPDSFAQEIDAIPTVGTGFATASAPAGFLGTLGAEAKLYLGDAAALATAPLSWSAGDRRTAAGVAALVGGLMIFDERLSRESQERRSSFTNRISHATSGLGSTDALILSGGLVLSGITFRDQRLTLLGREAIEASIFTVVIASALKTGVGRVRPDAAHEENSFEPASSNYSFPSGHSTEAFAVASVIAARSPGWLVPTLAYTGATLVALDRVNDHAHFPSDVVAGAAIGVAVGRFIVHRHEAASESPRADISLTPLPRGIGLVARF